ncbi:MAG: helix-turn-helix domain-containing protein [Erythrobacter sp.]
MKLADWRRASGMTQEELAARLGLIPGSVARYESGSRLPAPAVMIRLFEISDGAVQPNDFYALPDAAAAEAA